MSRVFLWIKGKSRGLDELHNIFHYVTINLANIGGGRWEFLLIWQYVYFGA